MSLQLTDVELRKVQLLELKCLDEVKRICQKHNINYFLIGGTLIGAARHRGFIPWDDDIDIGMLRKDYDRFLEVCPTEINKETFFLQTPDTEKGCADYEITRIRLNNTKFVQKHRRNLKLNEGIFIEILPYDDLPDNEKKCKQYYLYFKYMKRFVGIRKGYRYEICNSKFKRFLFYCVANLTRIIPLGVLEKQMKNYHLKYYNTNSENVFLLGGAYYYKKERHLRKTVSEYTTLEFEGDYYPVPKEYDLFLREQYGDYMKMPAKSKRVNKCVVEQLDFGPYSDIEIPQTDTRINLNPSDNYTEIELKKIQACLLLISKEIKRICEKNDIPYFMLAGTLLGAVRHKGFIPWDDDMDFGMLRDDYERFIKACEKDLNTDMFFVQRTETDPNFAKFYTRILLKGTYLNYPLISKVDHQKGFFVDVFPYDSIPSAKILQKKQSIITTFVLRLLKKKLNYSFTESSLIQNIELLFSFLFSKKTLFKLYNKEMQRYNASMKNSEYINCANAGYGYYKEILKRKWILELQDFQFEDTYFKGPVLYDEYLTHLYNDYMTIPPEDKRVTHKFADMDFGKYENILENQEKNNGTRSIKEDSKA